MNLNSCNEHETTQVCGIKRPKWFYNLLEKLFAYTQQMLFIIALMSSSYSKVFWLSLYEILYLFDLLFYSVWKMLILLRI